ncbi:MAG TPA: hypothetical protein VGB24_11685 [Longimicrobium sp.]|jgi:hypothetical protein|uniref:hypothetical protein n=1 Tax=Longimicrobium sp. TaxID=2029185 RepID=UPI002EDB2402
MSEHSYERSIFINCPFDRDYQPLFRALTFAVHDCGFIARCALEADDGGEVRIAKIQRIIRDSQHGIHDISRTELDIATGLPRFNMPFELGLFLGAREFGAGQQKKKRALILDRERYRYQKFCSDISGQDIKAHEGSPQKAIRAVRNWLITALAGNELLLSTATIANRYEEFTADLPDICEELLLDVDDLQFVELRALAEEWVLLTPASVPAQP